MKPLLVDGMTALRDGYVLLDQIRCEIKPGQITGVIADNPDRLNFLLDILGGMEQEQSGKVLYAGRPWSPAERRHGVGIARERVSLVDSLGVLDNLFLSNRRIHTWFGFLNKSKRRFHARTILRRLECQASLEAPLQKVEPQTKVILDVARVLIQDPLYCAFQGVTRTMSLRQYTAFEAVLKELKARGKGVLVIPINDEDVRRLVDRLYFLEGSQLFEVDHPETLTDEQLHAFFLGTDKKRYQTSSDPIQKARARISELVEAEDLDVQDLAKDIGMSYDNFRRRFKQQVGMSPHQYFIAQKIERAKELLLFTDLEIKDVALQLGFSDPYYFSRFFKERTHTSPAHFRKGNAGLEP